MREYRCNVWLTKKGARKSVVVFADNMDNAAVRSAIWLCVQEGTIHNRVFVKVKNVKRKIKYYLVDGETTDVKVLKSSKTMGKYYI